MKTWMDRAAAALRRCALVVAALIAVACGGGGAGSSAGTGTGRPEGTGPAVPIATESEPIGPRVDLVAAGYMSMVQGQVWVYAVQDANGMPVGTSTRTLAQAPAGGVGTLQFTVVEDGTTTTQTFRAAADGLYASLEGSTVPAGMQAAIGEIREYAFPSYAAGEARQVVRAGPSGLDLDGDGREDTFRLEFTQTFDGIVPFPLPWDPGATAARFSALLSLVIQSSASPGVQWGAVTRTQNAFAKGIGPVGGTESIEDLQGNRLEISGSC